MNIETRVLPAALYHGLELVTGNVRHFARVPGLRILPALAGARQDGPPAPVKHRN